MNTNFKAKDNTKQHDSSVKPTKQISKKIKLKSFLDEIDTHEEIAINKALLEMLIAHKISFDILQSKYCLDLLHLLRPAYKVPPIETLEILINEIYRKHVENCSNIDSIGILSITMQENDKFMCTTFSSDGKIIFLKNGTSPDICLETMITEVNEKLEKKVYTVVANFDNSVYESRRTIRLV